MRDARTQSRQNGSDGRDRALARRRARPRHAIDLAVVADAFLRLAGAIVLETFSFVVWNVGTRSPAGLIRDIVAAARNGRRILIGLARFVIGLIFVSAAVVLLLPALVDPFVDFLPAELFTLLVALAIEHLIGNDVRAIAATRE